MADVFHTLVYYYDHRDECERREREAETTRQDGERRTRELLEQVERGRRETGEQAD